MRTHVVLLVLLSAVPAFAQVGYGEAIIACEKAAAEMANLAAEARNEAMAAQRADAIRDKSKELNEKFIKASQSLTAERARLNTSPKDNAAALKRLDEAEKRLETARSRLKVLTANLADNATVLNAVRSGFLERTANEVSAATGEVGKALQVSSASLGNANVGAVELRELKVNQGKLRLFVVTGDKEEELVQGRQVSVPGLPIVIRAEVRDQNRTRLEEQKAKGLLPAGTEFVETDGKCKPGRKFAYENARVGRTNWTAKETLKWEPRGDTQEQLKGFAQRASDPCSENDVVELHTKGASVQRLVLGLTGKASWKRQSQLKGGNREETVEPQDGTVDAELVLSVWPK
jgi:hypothetical protein